MITAEAKRTSYQVHFQQDKIQNTKLRTLIREHFRLHQTTNLLVC